jgi:hypothetical protein
MTVVEIGILATCIINAIGMIGGLFISWGNRTKITQVHDTTNSKMDAFIKEVREASFAKGVKSEQDKAI